MDKERVMFSVSRLKIMFAKRVLAEQGIEAFVLDQLDSIHAGAFGDIKLYVDAEQAVLAKNILQEAEIIE